MTSFRSIYVLLVARYERTTPLLSKLLLLCILSHMPIISTLFGLFLLKKYRLRKKNRKKFFSFPQFCNMIVTQRVIWTVHFPILAGFQTSLPISSPYRISYCTTLQWFSARSCSSLHSYTCFPAASSTILGEFVLKYALS